MEDERDVSVLGRKRHHILVADIDLTRIQKLGPATIRNVVVFAAPDGQEGHQLPSLMAG
ncbi:MAG: hypothetical protein R2855_16310 [Thermomicrobiales bacterium]